MSSSTPEGPRDVQGAPEPQREDTTAATEAVPAATPSTDETQRIAPTPTQQLPHTPAPQAGPAAPQQGGYPAPYPHGAPQHPAAQQPGQQPRYGQYAPFVLHLPNVLHLASDVTAVLRGTGADADGG
ncbi:hypothetical protein FA014_19470, partial [Cellulomonas hominis]